MWFDILLLASVRHAPMMTLLNQPVSQQSFTSDYKADGVMLVYYDDLNCTLDVVRCANDVWGYVSPSGAEYALVGGYDSVHLYQIYPTQRHIFKHSLGAGSKWGDYKTYKHWAYCVKDLDPDALGITTLDLSRVDSDTVTVVDTSHNSSQSLHIAHNIAVDETSGFLYQMGLSDDGVAFVVYSVLNGPPVEVARYLSQDRYVHDAQVITYTTAPYAGRQIMFACTAEDGTLWVVDVTDKQNMSTLSEVRYPGIDAKTYSHQVWLDEAREYAYLNDEVYVQTNVVGSTTLIFDVRDLTNVQYVQSYSNELFASNHNNYVLANKLYMANYASGLRIADITDRRAPQETAFFDTHPRDDLTCINGRCGSSEFSGAWGMYPYLPSGSLLLTDTVRGLFVLRERSCTEALLDLTHVVRLFRDYLDRVSTQYCDDTDQNGRIDLVEVVDAFRAYVQQG